MGGRNTSISDPHPQKHRQWTWFFSISTINDRASSWIDESESSKTSRTVVKIWLKYCNMPKIINNSKMSSLSLQTIIRCAPKKVISPKGNYTVGNYLNSWRVIIPYSKLIDHWIQKLQVTAGVHHFFLL